MDNKEIELSSIKWVIENNTKNIDDIHLISSIFIKEEKDVILYELSKKIEYVFLLFVDKKSDIKTVCIPQFDKLVDYVKENNLYKHISKIFYLMYKRFNHKNFGLFNSYLSFLQEIWDKVYIDGYQICGYDKETDKPLHVKLDMKELDTIRNIIRNKKKSPQFNKEKLEELKGKFEDYKNLSGSLSSISYFADNDDLEFMPNLNNISFNTQFSIRNWKETEYYVELLKSKKYTLPSSGVICTFSNASNIKEIVLKEKIYEDGMALLFFVKTTNGKIGTGVYIHSQDLFIDEFSDHVYISEEYGSKFSYKNFLLEVYAHLVCDIDIDKKKRIALKIVEDIENPTDYFLSQPLMEVNCIGRENNKYANSVKKEKSLVKRFIKYDYQIKKTLKPFIRKLPEGYKASEEAKAKALQYGYHLEEGETFIAPFTKKINLKNKK